MNDTQCRFEARRKNRSRCKEKCHPDTHFCKQHERSVQARKMQMQMQMQIAEKREKDVVQGGTPPSGDPLRGAHTYREINVSPNQFGNFEDKQTGIIFDEHTCFAIGVQCRESGDILPLTPNAINRCEINRWRWDDTVISAQTLDGRLADVRRREAAVAQRERALKLG